MVDIDEFCGIARYVNRSSPGPDGVPHHAWLVGRASRCAFSTLRLRPWQPELDRHLSSTRRFYCSSRRAARRRAMLGMRLKRLSVAHSRLAISSCRKLVPKAFGASLSECP